MLSLTTPLRSLRSQVLAERATGGGVTSAAAGRADPRRRIAVSRFARDAAAGGGAAGGGAASTPSAAAPPDPFVRALERPRPRAYVGGRIIVFVVGGISLAEMATLERISAETGREIIYGGTSVMTPRDALDQLLRTEEPADGDEVDAGAGVGGT